MPKAKAKPKAKKKTAVADVVDASSVQPEDTSRPIVVSNHTMIKTDPMVAGGPDTSTEAEQTPADSLNTSVATITIASAPPVKRTAKALQPIVNDVLPADWQAADTSSMQPLNNEMPQPTTAPDIRPNTKPQGKPETIQEVTNEPAEPEVIHEKVSEPEATSVAKNINEAKNEASGTDESSEASKETVDEAAKEKLAAAEAAHRDQLAKLIESGKYHVPINAVQKRRSLHASLGLTLLIVLAALLVDLMLDANLIELIQKLPHTHFFESK